VDWGYAVYGPVTAVLGRVELVLFGTSLIGFRFFPAIVQGVVLVLTGLIARELGGLRESQLVAATAVAIGGPSPYSGASLSYTTFDYLWWVAVACFVARLLRSEDARRWVAIGVAMGLGMLTKYSMAFFGSGCSGRDAAYSGAAILKKPSVLVWNWPCVPHDGAFQRFGELFPEHKCSGACVVRR
jgi:hypothetical protein